MLGALDGQLRLRRGADDPPWALQMFDDELGLWLTLAQADELEEAMRAGIPVLRGPYVVEYTDIPHDGDTKTLWTPQVGDVLLALGVSPHRWTNWDTGVLSVETTTDPDQFINSSNAGGMSGLNIQCYLFTTTDPVQIRLHETPGTDPSQGHVELYALVAQAVAP
jgi:hypothetical protein